MNFSEHEELMIKQDSYDFEQYWLSMQDPMNTCMISF